MKTRVRISALACFTLIACAAVRISAPAQSTPATTPSTERWVGVWQGQLEGVPGVTLTLGNDLGEVAGTIVFTVLRDGRVAGHQVRLILHPRVEGSVLSFQVMRLGADGEILDMSLALAGDNKGQLHCAKCGAAASTEMAKLE